MFKSNDNNGARGFPIIEIKDLSVSYRQRISDKWLKVISGLTLCVNERDFLALIGLSGSGKTTLLHTICGLLEETRSSRVSGRVLVRGHEPNDARRQRLFSLVPQKPALLDHLTVFDNVCLPCRLVGERNYEDKAREAIAIIGLEGFETALPYELSGGMATRVSLARALAWHAPILMMDEPFSHLDEITRDKLTVELLRIFESMSLTVIFVSHNVREVAFLADRVAFLAGKPANIAEEVCVPFSRPRANGLQSSVEFAEFWSLLRTKLDNNCSTTGRGNGET